MDKSGNPNHLITTPPGVSPHTHTHTQMALSSVKPFSSIFSNSNPPLFTSAKTQQSLKKNNIDLYLSRRDLMNVGLCVMPLVLSPPPPPSIAREVAVGSYLPPSPTDTSFVLFKATPKDTPALRAGNVQPYTFILPPTWKQTRVANILSGNYCQPKCAEPWVEVKFEDEKQGKVQVVASPLIRLTNKPNATIEDIGTPEKVIASLGPFVTGNTLDPDELLETSIEKRGDLTVTVLFFSQPFIILKNITSTFLKLHMPLLDRTT
uniref:PsbP domain-containing protein 6, chloroplastic isoform X2 n=1 Tax=Nicotiana tabacum TaxID=4097 RepID=A0A1S4CHZ0_TOBAC|nr:PREDICTED: psbP domain-containing protein 6, chloroplastic-like isoform X2 [Nicotiana tabacum]